MTLSEKIYSLLHYTPSRPLKGENNLLPGADVHGFMPATLNIEQQKRQNLYDTMVVRSSIFDTNGAVLVHDVPGLVRQKAAAMLASQARYEAIAAALPGVKWWLIALIHTMECSLRFDRYLGNGDPLNKRTTHVPKGRPVMGKPPFSFYTGALDALRLEGADKITDWSIGSVLYFLEGFNGYGYAKYRGINSPYLWSGSSNYTSGKYISDGVYSPTAVSGQIGTALLLKSILQGTV